MIVFLMKTRKYRDGDVRPPLQSRYIFLTILTSISTHIVQNLKEIEIYAEETSKMFRLNAQLTVSGHI